MLYLLIKFRNMDIPFSTTVPPVASKGASFPESLEHSSKGCALEVQDLVIVLDRALALC